MAVDLKKRASTAIRWSTIEQSVQQGLIFAVSVMMARLVAPEAFGTVALLQLFTGVAMVFVDGGLSAALIQKKNCTQSDESTVFWFNMAVGVIMGAALFIAAPSIASFYEIAVLQSITQLYAFQFILGAANSVQNTLFRKNLDFKTPLKVNSIAILVSASVGIYMAWTGYGVWALVIQGMIMIVIQTGLIWIFSSWRPTCSFSKASFKRLFSFGGYMFLSGILNTIYLKSYTLLIGKYYGVRDLGIYNRADNTRQLPSQALSSVISRVAFPIFSEASEDKAKLLRGFRLAIRGSMFFNIPLMFGVMVVAEPLILTLFGDVWASATPLLRVLAIAGVLRPWHELNLSLLMALGHSSKFFKIEVIKKSVGLVCIVTGSFYGVQGLAWAVLVSEIFSYFFNAHYSGKFMGHGAWKQTLDCLPAFVCGILMISAVFTLSIFLHMRPVFELLLLSVSGAVLYFSFAKLFNVREFSVAVDYLNVWRRKIL